MFSISMFSGLVLLVSLLVCFSFVFSLHLITFGLPIFWCPHHVLITIICFSLSLHIASPFHSRFSYFLTFATPVFLLTPVSRARSSRRLSSKRNYYLPVVIIMLIRVKHIPVIIYNSNAMQIKLISCADISEI